ncbi:Serine/threonine-protein phosphatase 6 regulatory ankyrin repeat subunit B [Durusdinium trenchii]|uniref:Serine/threonine-protein phosphatase 6 regulatory ankyrin repeat subunit B n=1 Tax=Durusdinium trenchii TaxID=1381693 RepID=A0ABP0RE78_9DINO
MHSMDESPLSRFASSLSPSSTRFASDHGVVREFPMYTLPVETVLQLKKLLPHEEAWELESPLKPLQAFREEMGRAIFVSHQWLSAKHPDPHSEQLRILQATLGNLLSGAARVSLQPLVELARGRGGPVPVVLPKSRWTGDSERGLKQRVVRGICQKFAVAMDRLTVNAMRRLDMFGMTSSLVLKALEEVGRMSHRARVMRSSSSSEAARAHRHLAISSIPSYVARSFFFMILCPPLRHQEQRQMLNYSTWATRGWCRLERLARELARREDGYILIAESPYHIFLEWQPNAQAKAPGSGQFSVEADRARVGKLLLKMVWSKLLYYLERGEFNSYRFQLNLQRVGCLEGLEMQPIEGLVPNFSTDIDPEAEPERFVVARFLHDNGFIGIRHRDTAGWTPICYAAVNGNCFLPSSSC